MPIPVWESTGAGMVDTGARIMVIDIEYARDLGLEEDGTHPITGATGEGEYPRFKTDIEGPWLNLTGPSPVGGALLRTNNIPWNGLIGRDVILQFEMHVDGTTGMITFLKEVGATGSFLSILNMFLALLGLLSFYFGKWG